MAPDFNGRKNLVILGEARQNQNAGIGVVLLDVQSGLDAVHPRHHQIQQDNIRFELPRQADGLYSVGSGADHFHARLC